VLRLVYEFPELFRQWVLGLAFCHIIFRFVLDTVNVTLLNFAFNFTRDNKFFSKNLEKTDA
jgi:hypothetical protein